MHLNNKGKELIAKELLKNCSVKLKSQKVDAIQLSWKEGSVKEGAPITENISSSEILNTSTNHHSRETTITVMKESTLDQPNPSLINSPTNEQEILNTITCGHTMESAAPVLKEFTSVPSWTATPSSNQDSLQTNTGGNTIVSTIPTRKEPTFEQIIPSLTTSPSISNTTTSVPSTVPTIPVRNESTSDQSLAQLPHQQTIKGTKMKIKIQEWDQLTRLHHPQILISVKPNLGIPIAAKNYQLLDLMTIFGD